MEQVLINLLKNAKDAGSDPKEIVVSVQELEDGFQLKVADRGHGLSEEALNNAMLPFWSTKTEGTGLGLALCRDIIVAHGGWIALNTRVGGGDIITIWLP